jgi:hypothetical protein
VSVAGTASGRLPGLVLACLRGTDTGLIFAGQAEWAIAGLTVLGLPDSDAQAMTAMTWAEQYGCAPGEVPAGRRSRCGSARAASSGVSASRSRW